ncbi:MAG: arylesterase [Rhizobiales bacterium]|nr:arylesterase [Hyphomicrobiales bacterium]
MNFQALGGVFVVLAVLFAVPASAIPLKIVALGDSLTAGYGLAPADGFAEKLEKALKSRGHDVEIVNAGVSGDTTSGGLARLDWALGSDTDAVIIELGANDMLRGLPVQNIRDNLDAILRQVQARGLPVVLAGMRAAPNLGVEYGKAFDAIFPELAEKYGALFYPFFLEGVAGSAALNQADGIHPQAAGVDIIVRGILPVVETLITAAKATQ